MSNEKRIKQVKYNIKTGAIFQLHSSYFLEAPPSQFIAAS
jgi:hypothetical protein